MAQETDAVFVIAARAGDKNAFGELVERYFATARLVALRLVTNQEIANELTQEALLQAYLSLSSLREPARFAPWLYGIVRNVCRTWLRSQRVNVSSLDLLINGDEAAPLHLVDPLTLLEAREQATLIHDALTTLSPKNGAAAWLFYYEGLRIDEIAITLGASPTAIKGRLYQARKQLQQYLAPLRHTPHSPTPLAERRPKMTTITAVHVLKIERTGHHGLYLLDTVNHRCLQMWIGSDEGEQIRRYLNHETPGRPLSYHSIAALLQALDVKLEEVRIAALKNHIFYAVARFRNGDMLRELDARPSNAIAVALHMQSPIRVDDQLMRDAGQPLPADLAIECWLQNEAQRLQQAFGWRDKLVQEHDRTFTQQAQLALQAASANATVRQHNYIGTEHLLYGLMTAQESLAARVLYEQQVMLAHIDAAIDRLVGRGDSSSWEEPIIVPRVATVLSLAVAASQQGRQSYIGTEHLLLGLLQEGNGMAITLLRDLGVDPVQVQVRLLELMAASA